MSTNKRNFIVAKAHRRSCPIKASGIENFDYKDVEFLKMFITEKGKIIPKRISGVNSKNQKKLAKAIKRARHAALLSFSEGYVPQEIVQQ